MKGKLLSAVHRPAYVTIIHVTFLPSLGVKSLYEVSPKAFLELVLLQRLTMKKKCYITQHYVTQ